MKVTFEENMINMALQKLNEISVTGIINAENLIIVATILRQREKVEEKEEKNDGEHC